MFLTTLDLTHKCIQKDISIVSASFRVVGLSYGTENSGVYTHVQVLPTFLKKQRKLDSTYYYKEINSNPQNVILRSVTVH